MVSVKMNKISKTISIPYWYRCGFIKPYMHLVGINMVFGSFAQKKNVTDVLSPFLSQICVTQLKFFSKQQ